MQISTYLVEARLKSGLSRNKIAKLMGVSSQHVYKIEIGDSIPSAALCEKFARHLGLDRDVVLLKAGHVPPDMLEILQKYPVDACTIIRQGLPTVKAAISLNVT